MEWISIKDKLPKKEDNYIFAFDDGFIATSLEFCADNEEVTHWMPLPEPPDGATGNG